ncbi:MAG TPA: SRPBCC family protein [Chitinophagaceae bacterium]|nr:SRPBCC family protein [Chitinophagaceae bacterium]
MNILIIILLVVAGIIVLLLTIALFMKREHYVNREIIINAPKQKVFDFLKLLKNQDQFNKWAAADKNNRKEEFKGTDGTVGYIYSWSGNKKACEGEKEIKNIVEGKRIETEIRFVKPMRASASVIFETESLSENQTKVNLINTGTLKYPMNIFVPIAEKRFPKDMDESLSTLKNILEK